MLAAKVRSAGPTGVGERGKGTGGFPRNLGDPALDQLKQPWGTGLNKWGRALAEVSAASGANDGDKSWSGGANP